MGDDPLSVKIKAKTEDILVCSVFGKFVLRDDFGCGEYCPSGDVFPKNGRGQSVRYSGELN